MTWQATGNAGDLSCNNRPTVFFSVLEEERAGSVGIWI